MQPLARPCNTRPPVGIRILKSRLSFGFRFRFLFEFRFGFGFVFGTKNKPPTSCRLAIKTKHFAYRRQVPLASAAIVCRRRPIRAAQQVRRRVSWPPGLATGDSTGRSRRISAHLGRSRPSLPAAHLEAPNYLAARSRSGPDNGREAGCKRPRDLLRGPKLMAALLDLPGGDINLINRLIW